MIAALNPAMRSCAGCRRAFVAFRCFRTHRQCLVLTLFTRIVIFALAAVSLNLIMAMADDEFWDAPISGIGGYAVGILAAEGIGSRFVQWPVALLTSRCSRS